MKILQNKIYRKAIYIAVKLLACFVILSFINNRLYSQENIDTGNAERIKYNNLGLEVDMGVGLWAWPLPMDYDQDGDPDLLVSSGGKPYNGIYFFENTSGDVKMPVFKPSVRLGNGYNNIQISYIDEEPRLLIPGQEIVNFKESRFEEIKKIYPERNIHEDGGHVRGNQWKYVDYDGNGIYDLVVGVGAWGDHGITANVNSLMREHPYKSDWTIFSDAEYNKDGHWTGGPVHGYVYVMINKGTNQEPDYADPQKIQTGGTPIDVFGRPSPNFADFDADGDLDIICGEFLDKLTYFENIGTRTNPQYAKGRYLTYSNVPIEMDLEMIVPVAYDWDKDGDMDLIVGDEDGRVALIEHTRDVKDGMPQFLPPRYFRQEADEVKFGALATPYSVDWDHDGDEDLIVGNTAGHIGFIENLDGGDPPTWAAPKYLEANGKMIRILAGYAGSIKGPSEAKWGYTTLSVVDWDHDGLLDLVVNDIWGKVHWYRNKGPAENPKLAEAQSVQIRWDGEPIKPEWNWWDPVGNNFVTQWRTTPFAIDLTDDGLADLVMLDPEGYLTLYERKIENGKPYILPGKRIFLQNNSRVYDSKHRVQGETSRLLRLNSHEEGGSGRRKFAIVDWDLDGRLDLLVNSDNGIDFMRNVSTKLGEFIFEDQGSPVGEAIGGHTTSPTTVDWDSNGVPDLLFGAEDGFLYYLKNIYATNND